MTDQFITNSDTTQKMLECDRCKRLMMRSELKQLVKKNMFLQPISKNWCSDCVTRYNESRIK